MMLFQFFSDRKLDQPQTPAPARPSSSLSCASSNDQIDWRKEIWSFEKDYVSFPSLDPPEQDDSLPWSPFSRSLLYPPSCMIPYVSMPN